MALTVLIVEDEQSASRLLSAIAAEVGLSARTTGSAREAQELCDQGHSSGQPFEPAALRAALARLSGAQSAAPALEGPLSARPAAAVLVQLLRDKATGVLTVTHDAEKRVLTFQQGMVRFAQSNVRAETVGAAQIASGLIKQTSFDRAVALAKQQN